MSLNGLLATSASAAGRETIARVDAVVRSATGASEVWGVSEHRVLDIFGTTEPPAVARFGFPATVPQLSRAEFGAHGVTHHAPPVVRHGPLFHRYVIHLDTDDATPWDGLVEQWFPSAAAGAEHDRLVRSSKKGVLEDMGRFVSRVVQYRATDALVARTTHG